MGDPVKRTTWEQMRREARRSYANPNRECIERGCTEPAGTPWGKHWCADHDDERMHRISDALRDIQRAFKDRL